MSEEFQKESSLLTLGVEQSRRATRRNGARPRWLKASSFRRLAPRVTITLVAERGLLFALWKVRGLLSALKNARDVGVSAILDGFATATSVTLAIDVARPGCPTLANAAARAPLAFVAADCASGVIVRIPAA